MCFSLNVRFKAYAVYLTLIHGQRANFFLNSLKLEFIVLHTVCVKIFHLCPGLSNAYNVFFAKLELFIQAKKYIPLTMNHMRKF